MVVALNVIRYRLLLLSSATPTATTIPSSGGTVTASPPSSSFGAAAAASGSLSTDHDINIARMDALDYFLGPFSQQVERNWRLFSRCVRETSPNHSGGVSCTATPAAQ